MRGAEAFELLGFDPRPLLDPDEVERAYRARAREAHPDAGGSAAAFQRLNSARQTLAAPAPRLQALLETLPVPENAAQEASPRLNPALAALSFDAAGPLRELGALPGAKTGEGIAAVAVAARKIALSRLSARLEALRDACEDQAAALDRRLEGLDARWQAAHPPGRAALRPEIAALRADFLALEKLRASLRDALARRDAMAG